MPDYTEQFNQALKNRIVVKKKKKPVPVRDIGGVEFLIIGTVALASDICDYVGLDVLLFRMVDLTTSAILGFWCLFRLHKFPSARFAATIFIELVPGLGDISPTWTIFIITLYFNQKTK